MATSGARTGSSGTNLGTNDLFNVYEALHSVREKYKLIGLGIGVEKSTIDFIRKNSDPDDCLLEVLSFRLNQTPALTWADIIKVLRSRVIGKPLIADEIEKSLDKLNEPSFERMHVKKDLSEEGKGPQKVVPSSKESIPIVYTDVSKKSSDEEVRNDSDTIKPRYDSLVELKSHGEKESERERLFIMKAIRTRRLVEPRVAEDIEESLEKQEKPSTEKKYQYKEGMGKWGKAVPSSEEGIPIGCTKESKKSSDEEVSSKSDTIQPQYDSPSVTKSTSQSERESAGGQSSPSSILLEQYRVKATSKASVAIKYQLSSQCKARDGTKPRRMSAGNEYPHHVHTELSREREINSDEKTSSHLKEEIETEGDRHDERRMQGERGEGRGQKGKWRKGKESERFATTKRPRIERESSQKGEVASSHFKGQVETEYDHHDERKMQGVGGEGTGREGRRRNGREDVKQLQSEGLTSGKQSQMKKESRQKDVHIHLTESTQQQQHYSDNEMKKKPVSRHRSIPHEEEEGGNELFFSCSSGEDISEGEIEKRVKSRTMEQTSQKSSPAYQREWREDGEEVSDNQESDHQRRSLSLLLNYQDNCNKLKSSKNNPE